VDRRCPSERDVALTAAGAMIGSTAA